MALNAQSPRSEASARPKRRFGLGRLFGGNKNGNGATDLVATPLSGGTGNEGEWPIGTLDDMHGLRMFMGYSHISDRNRIVRHDGRRIAVFQVKGKEISQTVIGNYAGALNSITAHVQFLIRQHSPKLNTYRENLRNERTVGLSEIMEEAADSVDELLLDLEQREGMMDRRFYIITAEEHIDDVLVALERVQLKIAMLSDRALEIFMLSCLFGQAPADLPDQPSLKFRHDAALLSSDNGNFRQTIWVSRYPRNLDVDFLTSILTIGIPMDVSFHINQIPTEEASRKLQRQVTSRQGNTMSQLEKKGMVNSEDKFALQDAELLKDLVMRGQVNVFWSSWYITVHAPTEKKLKENIGTVRSMFSGVMARTDTLKSVQRKAVRSTMPLAENALNHNWIRADTPTLGLLFPFTPPDMDTRSGPLLGIDVMARALVTLDIFNAPNAQNMNVSVTATSGAGKSFFTKQLVKRYVERGVAAYIIDPEGEYVDIATAACGRVYTPGKPGQGLNPFVITETGVDGIDRQKQLGKLLQVMIGERLDAKSAGRLDAVISSYYQNAEEEGELTNWSGLYEHLREKEEDLAVMLSPFYSGTERFLLADDENDLLANEAPITVFNLKHVEDEKKAAAGMVCAEAVRSMSTDDRERLMVSDETWLMLMHPAGAQFMMDSAKRARKYNISLVSVTQDIHDFLAENRSEGVIGNAGKSVITNASNKVLLRQDPAAVDIVMKTFNLDLETAQMLPSLPTGRGLLVTPDGQYVVDFEATAEEIELFKWVRTDD